MLYSGSSAGLMISDKYFFFLSNSTLYSIFPAIFFLYSSFFTQHWAHRITLLHIDDAWRVDGGCWNIKNKRTNRNTSQLERKQWKKQKQQSISVIDFAICKLFSLFSLFIFFYSFFPHSWYVHVFFLYIFHLLLIFF